MMLGKRASGKTSLLNMVKTSALKKGFVIARLNLNEGDADNIFQFLFRVYNAVFTAAADFGLYGGLRSAVFARYLGHVYPYETPSGSIETDLFPLMFPIHYAIAMKSGNRIAHISEAVYIRDLETISKDLNKPIAVLIDEGGILAKSRLHLQYLRNIFMETGRYMMFLAGTPELLKTMDEVYSPISRQFKKVYVTRFESIDETETLIRRPLEKIGLPPDDLFDFAGKHAVREVHELTGGRPYEIQLLCHTLFRRVQEQRAFKMTVDYAVLEDVRKELETSQDVTLRPILTAIRGYTNQQLEAFSILTDLLGRATIDQLAALRQITHNDWTLDALRTQLEEFILASLLVVRQGGTIEFKGDDFDKNYIKYFARHLDITCEFVDMPPYHYLDFQVRRRLNAVDSINTWMSPARSDSVSLSFIDVFAGLTDPTNMEDIFEKKEKLAKQAYWSIIEYQHSSSVPALRLILHLPKLEMKSLWFVSPPLQTETLLDGVHPMVDRATKLGLTWSVTTEYFEKGDESVAFSKLMQTSNTRIRKIISDEHAVRMGNAFLDEQYEQALRHAEFAYALVNDLSPRARNNMGYVFLYLRQLDKAEPLFIADATVQVLPTYPALPLYNLAVLHAILCNYQAALEYLRQSIAALDLGGHESISCQSLMLPINIGGKLKFEQVRHHAADLVRIAKEARATILSLAGVAADKLGQDETGASPPTESSDV
jgi:hypothetical protein